MAHIALSRWAHAQVAVPASANLIARLALGLADDPVTATVLASPAPLLVVPAMETGMWRHPATRGHVATLIERGVEILQPVSGRLASGETGEGRMAEPDDVIDAVLGLLSRDDRSAGLGDGPEPAPGWLAGRRVVVTAGGTREPIDPVCYIGNRSSGKMGNALAGEAVRLGAEVTLVTAAPAPPSRTHLRVIEVQTAEQMLDAVRQHVKEASVLVMAAAVADYRPASVASGKIKKRDVPLTLELVPTSDVLRVLRDEQATREAIVVGFAAETDDLLGNASRKLQEKGLDLIVANDVGADGIGMGADDNAVVILGSDGGVAQVPRAPKPVVAGAVFDAVRKIMRL